MKTKLVVALAALAFSGGPAVAQGGPGPGARGQMMRNFDPATVVTVKGEVTAVHKIEGRRDEGTHVDLKVGDVTYDVHLGPSSFLAGKSLELTKGDHLEVTGSKVDARGTQALIAQTVKKGDTTVTLRDPQGVPAWARRPRK